MKEKLDIEKRTPEHLCIVKGRKEKKHCRPPEAYKHTHIFCKLLNYITFGPGGPWIPCGPGSPCNITHDINHISCYLNTRVRPLSKKSFQIKGVQIKTHVAQASGAAPGSRKKLSSRLSRICCFNVICLNNVFPVFAPACPVSTMATCLEKMMRGHGEQWRTVSAHADSFSLCAYSQPYCVAAERGQNVYKSSTCGIQTIANKLL